MPSRLLRASINRIKYFRLLNLERNRRLALQYGDFRRPKPGPRVNRSGGVRTGRPRLFSWGASVSACWRIAGHNLSRERCMPASAGKAGTEAAPLLCLQFRLYPLTPAKAGAHCAVWRAHQAQIPASSGMTEATWNSDSFTRSVQEKEIADPLRLFASRSSAPLGLVPEMTVGDKRSALVRPRG